MGYDGEEVGKVQGEEIFFVWLIKPNRIVAL